MTWQHLRLYNIREHSVEWFLKPERFLNRRSQLNSKVSQIMRSLRFVTLILQFSLLTKSVFGRGSHSLSIAETSFSLLSTSRNFQSTITTAKDRNRNHAVIRKMLIEPSSEELSSSSVMITASAEQYSQITELKTASASTDAQYELSPQQFVYVVLTRWGHSTLCRSFHTLSNQRERERERVIERETERESL